MRTMSLVATLACLTVGALAADSLAAPPGKAGGKKVSFKKHEATGWVAELPSDWTLDKKRKYGARPEIGRHVFFSPSKNLQFRINITEDKGKPLARLFAANLERMTRRMMNAKIVKKDVQKEHALVILEGAMLRGDFMVPYFVARLIGKEPVDKTVVTLTLAGTAKRLDRFGQIFERLVASFDRRFPKPAAPAPKAKTPVKPVKGR